jgi:3-hydroxyacyl-CoA dehydrogenase
MTEAKGPVAVVGCGLVGSSWAIVFARAGHTVRLWDAESAQLERAEARIAGRTRDMEEAGLLDAEAASGLLGRIGRAGSVEEAVEGAVHVQESITEDPEAKRALFAELDACAAPATTLASSSSAIPGSRFMEGLKGRGRAMIAHPANPPHLIPLVELVPTPWTTPEALAAAHALLEGAGQAPIHVRKEVPGFVLSRIQIALINESISLVGRGVVSPDDLDKVMHKGLGLRWAFLGPLQVMDLNGPTGFASYIEHLRPTYEQVGDDLRVSERWTEEAVEAIDAARRAEVPAEEVSARHRWRDRRLMALLAHLAEAERDIGP